jgi:SAM-dependent methyltransferase
MDDVLRYDEVALEVNAPLYEYYARKIWERVASGGPLTAKGVCLDIGSAGGYLGLALAKLTSLDFVFLDISAQMSRRAKSHTVEDGLEKRAHILVADVHDLPLPNGCVSLVVSRGSIPFWKEPALALEEIYRVLAPGGMACVGGGKGPPEIRARIETRMAQLGIDWSWGPGERRGREGAGESPGRDYDAILKSTGIPSWEADRSEDGMWIWMWKQARHDGSRS